jgi:hypothetical protein
MKIRLEGTEDEINWACSCIKNNREMAIENESKLYANRDGKTFRKYIDVFPEPDRPAHTSS